MACQCGCCDTPAPTDGTDALQTPETERAQDDLQRQVEELNRRVKELETAA
jgi:hypothetical protein